VHVMAHDTESAQLRIRGALARAGLPAPQFTPQELSMEDVFAHRVLALEAAAAAGAA
jgi:hypothetical protein